MGVLQFTASGSNRLKWTSLASALADVSDGAWTTAAVVRFSAADSDFDGITYLLSSTGDGVVEAGISLNSTEELLVDVASQPDAGTALSGSTVYLVVAKKASGSVRPTYDWKQGSAGSWTHAAPGGGSTLPDQIDATMLEVGAWQNGDFFDGHIGLVGWWEGDMNNTQVEELGANWQTSDWWNHSFGQPAFLAEMNVAGASVVDLAGNASSLSVTGTSLDAAQTLDSWNFDGTGAADPVTTKTLAALGVG